jgi:hypothetical protein
VGGVLSTIYAVRMRSLEFIALIAASRYSYLAMPSNISCHLYTPFLLRPIPPWGSHHLQLPTLHAPTWMNVAQRSTDAPLSLSFVTA